MAKLREIIEEAKALLINKDPQIYESDDYGPISRALDIHDYLDELENPETNPGIESIYMCIWWCTDSYVGVKAFFLNGKPIGISKQNGRKDYENFQFISKWAVLACREHILNRIPEYDNFELLSDEDLEKEEGEAYTQNYGSSVLHKYGLYKNEPVEIIKKSNYFNNDPIFGEDQFHSVLIKKSNGEEEVISVKDLYFRYNQTLGEVPRPLDLKLNNIN